MLWLLVAMMMMMVMMLLHLHPSECAFVRFDGSIRRCSVPVDAVGCHCVRHLEGETHVSCVDAGLSAIPDGLRSPTTLELKGNAVAKIGPVGYPSLRQLRLTLNRIREIGDRAFDRLEDLVVLSLAHNRIRSLSAQTFAGLRSLELLNLDDNPIHELRSDAFPGPGALSNLRFLKISRCRVHTVEPGSFAGLHGLFQLNMSGNHITFLPVLGDRTGLPNLFDVDLSDNRLRVLLGSSLKHLTALHHLFLGGNRLAHLSRSSFPPAVKASLRSLWLRRNNLTGIEPGTFGHMTALATLDVSFNHLHELDPADLPDGVQKLLVHDNPWNCSCGKNQWMTERPFVRDWNAETQVTCDSPWYLRRVSAFDRATISLLNADCDRAAELRELAESSAVRTSRALWAGLGAVFASAVCLTTAAVAIHCSSSRRRRRLRRIQLSPSAARIYRRYDDPAHSLLIEKKETERQFAT